MNENLIQQYLEFKQIHDLKFEGVTIKDSRKKKSETAKLHTQLRRAETLKAGKTGGRKSLIHDGLADHTGSAVDSHVVPAGSFHTRNVELASMRSNPQQASENEKNKNS